MTDNKCPKGVNPTAYKQWKEEDRKEKVTALHDLMTALFKVEQIYEVASESDHPLEQAYALIYDFVENEGFADEI